MTWTNHATWQKASPSSSPTKIILYHYAPAPTTDTNLFACQVLLKGFKIKGFKNHGCNINRRILDHAHSFATRAGPPWRYLPSPNIPKEEAVGQIVEQDPVERGLVAILRCVDPRKTYEVRRKSMGGKRTNEALYTSLGRLHR